MTFFFKKRTLLHLKISEAWDKDAQYFLTQVICESMFVTKVSRNLSSFFHRNQEFLLQRKNYSTRLKYLYVEVQF